MDSRQERQARNEALVREVNERIEQVDQAAQELAVAGPEGTFEFLCECGRAEGDDIACEAHVEMTLEEYEEVRAQDDRFALSPGHENDALEDVVRSTDRFVIVNKKLAAEPLVGDAPRGAPTS